MLNKKLIQQLRNGEIAVENDGTIEQLQQVIKEAFPKDKASTSGISTFYFKCVSDDISWDSEPNTELPFFSVNDFFIEEKTFPRVMLVSDVDDIETASKRVIFMVKNGKYLGWEGAKTIEESERVIEVFSWDYAWEVEEQTFPITITEKQYNELTDEQKELINQINQKI
jgi:hypothetical protein